MSETFRHIGNPESTRPEDAAKEIDKVVTQYISDYEAAHTMKLTSNEQAAIGEFKTKLEQQLSRPDTDITVQEIKDSLPDIQRAIYSVQNNTDTIENNVEFIMDVLKLRKEEKL